jgi:hypothetical protein
MTHDAAEFVAEVKRVRDYGIRAGSLSDDDLIDALLPFDADPNESDSVKMARLRRAARKVYATLDEVTLDAVFRGKDPTRVREERKREAWWRIVDFRRRPGNLVILIGSVILLLAFHYTNWTQRVEATLRKSSDVSQVDYLHEMRRMIEIGRQIEDLRKPPYVRPDISSTDIATFKVRPKSCNRSISHIAQS